MKYKKGRPDYRALIIALGGFIGLVILIELFLK